MYFVVHHLIQTSRSSNTTGHMSRSIFVMMLVIHTASASVCSICPENTISEPGSYSIAACQCKAGLYGHNGGPCEQCDAGKYKTAAGPQSCTSCPLNTVSPPGSVVCQCQPGWYGPDGGPCKQCDAGTYKTTAGPQSCTSCPLNTVSPPGSVVCHCQSGWYGPDGGPCKQCDAGTYKTTAGPQTCTSCPLNAVSQPGSIVCQCQSGWYGPDGGPCKQCDAGTYKTTAGPQTCTSCPDNSGGSPAGSSRVTQCVMCAVGQSSAMVSNAAPCTEQNTIHRGDYRGMDCNMYKYIPSWGGSRCWVHGNCNACPCSCRSEQNWHCPEPYPPVVETFREVCTTCPPGHRGDGLACTMCALGTFSTSPVSDVCIVGAGNVCPVSRSLACSGRCKSCTPHTDTHSATIMLTDGPGKYDIMVACTYLVTSNYIVTLQFDSFATEQDSDFVTISRCTTASCTNKEQLLYTSGGTDLSAVYASDVTHPFLQLVFNSDGGGVEEGWIAKWNLGLPTPMCTEINCMPGQYQLPNNQSQRANSCANCPIGKSKPN